MAKVRFSCPKCQAVMQTSEEKIGFDIACPQCSHQFTLVEQNAPEAKSSTVIESSETSEETRQWVGTLEETSAEEPAFVPPKPLSPNVGPISSGSVIPPIYQGHAPSSFSCPYCQSRQPPIWKSEVSTAGWLTCVLLFFTTCIFFWVGFLIRDKYTVCSSCNARLLRTFL